MTRAHGEGSVSYHKSSGLWIAQVSLGTDASGKRVRKTAYGRTQADARAERDRMLREYRENRPVNAGNQSVETWLDEWIDHLEENRTLSPRTIRSYRDTIVLHITPRIGKAELRALTHRDVERMTAAIAKEGHTRTAQLARAVLRNALNDAIKSGILTRNAAALADAPEHRSIPRRALTLDEAKRVIAAPHPLRALWVTAIGTGMRQAELLGLHWQDVDLDMATVTVCRQLQWEPGGLVLRPLKTASSAATIPLPPFVVAALRDHRRTRPAIRGFVFRTRHDTPVDSGNCQRSWHRHCARLGIPHVPFHSLRHTTATLLHAEDVPDKAIQTIMRHARLDTTKNIYQHATVEIVERATAAMERILGAPTILPNTTANDRRDTP